MTTFTPAQGQAAAERLVAEQQAIVDRLIDLEDHPGRRLLNSTALAGVSLERRTEVLAGLATLWTLYESYQTTVVWVRTIMARRPRPTRAGVREIEALVTGAVTVAVPGGEASPLPSRMSLDGLVAEIHTIYGRIHRMVTAAEQVWIELIRRVDHCDTVLRKAERLAVDLDLAADQDPAPGVLSWLAGRLGEMRRIVLTDPLRLWANGAVTVTQVDSLITQCEQSHAELHALTELRQRADQRLDQVGVALTEAGRLRREITEQRRRVKTKIHVAPAGEGEVGEAGAPLADPLNSRLIAARDLHRHGQWRPLATELLALERDAVAALTRHQAELNEASRPLRERAELRGRLGAYRVKAAGLGRIEDLVLEHHYQRARGLLWSAPCDLRLAAAAVAEYQDAVNMGAMSEDPA